MCVEQYHVMTYQFSVVVSQFSIHAIGNHSPLCFPREVIDAGELCKAPLLGRDNLLSSWKLKLGTAKRLNRFLNIDILGADGEHHLANGDASSQTGGLTPRTAHKDNSDL